MKLKINLCKMGFASAILIAIPLTNSNATPPTGHTWTQTFNEDFNGTKLDTSKWTDISPFGGPANGASEGQGYYGSQISIADGNCTIDMHKETNFFAGSTRYWKSGIISTLKKFDQRFGYFETRDSIGDVYDENTWPWPAIWFMPKDNGWPPEADLNDGWADANFAWFTAKDYPASAGKGNQQDTHFLISDRNNLGCQHLDKGWHTFAMYWTPTSVRAYCDDIPFGEDVTFKTAPNQPFYWIFNLANHKNTEPPANTRSDFLMKIDWVKVWQEGGTSEILPKNLVSHKSLAPNDANGLLPIRGSKTRKGFDIKGKSRIKLFPPHDKRLH